MGKIKKTNKRQGNKGNIAKNAKRIKQNMEMELKRSHYYGMTQVDIFSEAPDPHPKTSSHFISAIIRQIKK
jgi:hypothetical protein